MIKTITILLFATFLSIYGFGQVHISGNIKDQNGIPIAYATIEFKKEGKSFGKIADSIGNYAINLPDTGRYVVNVASLNYKDTSYNYSISKDELSVNFQLKFNNSNELGGVVVSSQKRKPLIIRKLDRVVMNVADNPVAAGRSSLELFSMAPGVFVNNGSISINGVTGSKVMVNGKLLKLSGDDLKQYLQSLKSNDIQSIEIIAHPPAEYDAEGSGGLLNIVLKKNAKQGWNGYIGNDYNIGVGKYPEYNPYVSLNYKHNKLELSSKYSYDWAKSYEDLTQNRELTDNSNYNSISNSNTYSKSHRVTLGAIYEINKNQTLSLEYTGRFGESRDSTISQTSITYPYKEKNNTYSYGKFPSSAKSNYSDYGLNYNYTTDSLGSELKVVSDYIFNNRNAINYNNSMVYSYNHTLLNDTSFIFFNPSTSKIWTADIQYNKKFRSGSQLSFGGKSSITRINNSNEYSIYNNQILNQYPDLGFNYKYSENIYAGFVNLTGSIFNTDYKIGVRGESSEINGQLSGVSQSDTNRYKYFNLFPDIFLQHSLDSSGNNVLSLSINRRLSRPTYSDLNPFKYYIDNYSLSQGNPYLRPMYTSALELGYTLKSKYYASIAFSRTTNIINQIIETNDNSANMLIMRQNAGSNNVLAMTFSIPVKITKWWETSNNLVLQYIDIKAPQYTISKSTIQLQTTQSFSFHNLFDASLNAFYMPRVAQGNIVTGRIASVDFGVSKNLFKNKLIAKANISDIFYTNNFSATAFYNDTKLYLTHKEQTRIATLSLIYNFSIGKSFKAEQIKKSNDAEQKRL